MKGDFFKGIKQWEFEAQGRKGMLPVFYYDNSSMSAIYTAKTSEARKLLPLKEMNPLGGTDAAAFSVKGIPAVCLHCQDTSRAVPNYHTRNDTYEHIRPESLSVSLQLVLDMLKQIDSK